MGLRASHYAGYELDRAIVKENLDDIYEQIRDYQFNVGERRLEWIPMTQVAQMFLLDEMLTECLALMERITL